MGSAAPRSLRCRNGTATPVLNACLPSCRGSTTPETVPPACTSPWTLTWTGKAGDTIAARDLFAALLPIWERVSGAKHPATLIARRNLAYWNEQVLNLG